MSAIHIPAAECYWAVLNTGGKRLGERALSFLAERVLPLPIEELQLAHTAIDSERVLLAAIEPARLRAALVDQLASSAIPAALPEHLSDRLDAALCTRLNFLHGSFEPAGSRRARRQALAIALVAAGLVLLLLLVGASRRRAHYQAAAEAITSDNLALLTSNLPPDPGSKLLPQMRLDAELRKLQAADNAESHGVVSVLPVLNGIFARWPDERIQVETLTASPRKVIVRGAAPDVGIVQQFSNAFDDFSVNEASWRQPPVQLRNEDERASYILTLEAP